MSKVAIAGAGRMGQALAESVAQADDLELAGVWTRGSSLADLLKGADVLIDFSLPAGTEELLRVLKECPRPLVCGVSGLNERQLDQLKKTATSLPVVYDRNMSRGIAILQRSVADAAKALGSDFSVQISETHHVHKKDAPSGTALQLAQAIDAARGEQGTSEIEFEVERRGEVAGDHEVVMRSAVESVSFAHSVTTRQVFIDGALCAARWLIGQRQGLYSMQDVLFADRP